MRKGLPGFGFTGSLTAQGEDIDDRFQIVFNEVGLAEERTISVDGTLVVCPHCEEKFILEKS